ncbi:MAG: hypothetical protein IJT76_06065 [Clostridia bacterium]|nr:hypothetical protein [Clostridia bacterium]
MDKLKFGKQEIAGSVYSCSAKVGSRQVPALEIRLEGAADRALLTAMTENDLEIFDDAGEKQGEQSGYHTLVRHSVILAKVTPVEQELADTQEKLRRSVLENAALSKENAALEVENAALLFESLTGEELK